MQVGDTVRWQIDGGLPWYAVVIGQPAGAAEGFFVISDERRSAIVRVEDCLVLPGTSTLDAEMWRRRYLRDYPGGLKP